MKLVWTGWLGYKTEKNKPQKGVPKTGFGDRQVGAFSVFRARHTGIPFIFWPKSRFFQKTEQFRGWCNTTPDCRVPGCSGEGPLGGCVLFLLPGVVGWLFIYILYFSIKL